MSELVTAAAEYLNAGLEIIFLEGKRPHTKLHPHGLQDPISGQIVHGDHPRDFYSYDGCPGCADMDRLTRTSEMPGVTGVGILIPQGVVVADIDSDEAAAVYMQHVGELPDTAIARTRNGFHCWFLFPGVTGSRWVGKLLLRGPGSYVAVAPSVHPDGGQYEWVEPLVLEGRVRAMAWLPEGLTRLLANIDRIVGTERHDNPEYTVLSIENGVLFNRPSIKGLVEYVRSAEEGTRNNKLAWAAMSARDEGVPYEVAEGPLTEAALEAGLTAAETRTTIRAAYRRSNRRSAA